MIIRHNQRKYFISSFALIFFSVPLGYSTFQIIYYKKDLTGVFDILLEGYINVYVFIGIMLYGLGLAKMLIEKNKID
ncbi:hypothetical protein UT300005_34100 [Clostridium sp. CTA-5]